MNTRAWTTVYWVSTLILILPFGVGGVFDFLAGPDFVSLMAHLGYPIYFLKMLGIAKLLGLLAILTNRSRTLKEWAYAGATFDLIAASISHAASGDGVADVATPLVFLVIVLISHTAWRKRMQAA